MDFTLEELKIIRIALKYYLRNAKMTEEQLTGNTKLYEKVKWLIAGKLPE